MVPDDFDKDRTAVLRLSFNVHLWEVLIGGCTGGMTSAVRARIARAIGNGIFHTNEGLQLRPGVAIESVFRGRLPPRPLPSHQTE